MTNYLFIVIATSVVAIAHAVPTDQEKEPPNFILAPAEVTIYKPHPEFVEVDQDDTPEFDEKQMEAALKEFIKSLNLTESEEKDDQVVGTLVLGMLEDLLNQVEQAEASGKEEDIEAAIKNINSPFWKNIFKDKDGKSIVPPIAEIYRKLNPHSKG
ncbi:hypothetical protein O0L34_g17474 [Tuta absoluta]|nr:hypothetical protein O0L34_g17474 [Tuta absoluta]